METNDCFIETMTKVQRMLYTNTYMKEVVWQKTNKGVDYIRNVSLAIRWSIHCPLKEKYMRYQVIYFNI